MAFSITFLASSLESEEKDEWRWESHKIILSFQTHKQQGFKAYLKYSFFYL